MCAVHLVPEVDELRVAPRLFRCAECRRIVQRGAIYRHIEGPLDDGTERRYLHRSHLSCYDEAEWTVTDDGCFTYRGVERI